MFPIYPFSFFILKNTLWSVPASLLNKKWDFLLYSYFDFIISIIVKFKYTLSKGILFIIAFIITFSFESNFLWIAIGLLLVSQFFHLLKRWDELFGPVKILQINLQNINENSPFSRETIEKQIFSKKKKDNKKKKKQLKMEQMEHFLLLREFSRIFNKKISDILVSQSYLKSFIFKSFYSFFFSMIIFGGVNFCLFQIDNSHFKFEGEPKFFDFFFYSFFSILPDGTDIEPITKVAKTFKMLAASIGIFINFLILAVYVTVNTSRYKKNLERVVIWSAGYSDEISLFFEEKYNKKPTEGLEWLKSLGSKVDETILGLKSFLNTNK